VVNFDKNWVEWNTVNNSEAIEKHRQKKGTYRNKCD